MAGETLVYNLQVDEPHTFLASTFVVHNKGGSSSQFKLFELQQQRGIIGRLGGRNCLGVNVRLHSDIHADSDLMS